MDQSSLPLNFYCRNARLCLKKATFSKKSQLFHDELSHLRQFESLVGSTIPEHAQFEDRKTEKQIVELQIFLSDARKRIQELEGDSNRSHILGNLKSNSSSKSDRSTPRSKSSTRSPRSISLTESSIATAVSQPSKSLKKSSRALPPASKKVDLSQQKQQSWGVWTANPHDTTLSPPTKKHASGIHKSRKLVDDLKSPSSSTRDAFFMPVRSSSPDQRAEAILGGCALLATHLQSFEDAKDDVETKREEFNPGFDSSRTGEQDKMSSSWLLNYSSRDRMDSAEAPNIEDDTDKGTIGGRRFKFATHYFEKKLQEKMNRLQQQCTNTAEDACGSSPSKVRTSAEAYQEQGSSEECLPGLGNLHTAFSSLRKHPESHLSLSSSKDRLQAILIEDDFSPGNDQLDAGIDDIWARKLVPAVEQKLTNEMLRARTPSRHSSNSSSRKKQKKKGILCVMDDAIRQAVDSDSDATNASSCKDAIEVATKSIHGSQKRENIQGKHSKRRVEDVLQHHPPAFQGLQVEALEKKITTLQSLVGDLKTSLEGFTSRVEEEVGTWQCRVEGVEVQMMNWRDNADKELMGIKGSIQIEVQMKLEELTKEIGKAERLLAEAESRKESTTQRMESRLEDCFTRLESLKRQVDSLVSDVKLTMNRDMRERVSQSVQDMSIGVKGDLDLLELGMSKDLENLRNELEVKFDAFRSESEKSRRAERQQMETLIEEKINRKLSPRMDMATGGKEKAIAEVKNELRAESERLRRAERQQIETLIEERIERRLSQPLEIVSGGKEKVMADMKTELRLLWTEVDLLIKGREEIKDNMEQLNQIAEKAKEAISKEQDLLKTENGSLKKQVQYFKKESMQTRIDAEDFKKDIELEVEDIRTNIRRLKDEGEDVKESIECLKKVRDDVTRENKSIRKLIEGMREEYAVRKVEAEAFRKGKEEFERIRGSTKDGSRDRTLIMERIENLSQLYLGGLDEMRRGIMSMKIACDDRLEELECQWGELKRQQENNAESEESLRELVLDGLETRISHLEHLLEKKENFNEERSKVQSTVAIIDKDREHAASALAQVAAASQKAEELISETLRTFHSEMTNMKRQSVMIQEKLLSEKDAAEAALSEVLRMRDHLGKETETTFSLISNAKLKTLELQEGLEREREGLRGSIMMAEKDRETALAAASEAAAAADKAGKALGEIFEVRRKSVSFSEHLTEVVGETRMKYSKELEGHIEVWNRSMQDEMLKAKSHVQGVEEEKRKSLHHIEGWRQEMLDEVGKAKTIIEGIQEEKRKSVSLTEATAFQERHDFEEHKRTTETTIQDLAKAIKEMSDSLDSNMHSMTQRQVHAEQEDEHLRREINDIGGKMKEALARLDKISMESSQITQEMQSSQAHGEKRSETLQQEIGALEKIVKETTAEQSAIVEKVKKVERVHKELVHSVEDIQTNTGELEKTGAMWLQKYETAARILQEIDKRLANLENASLEDEPSQQLNNIIKGHQIAPSEKQRLIRLYRELSGFLQKMKTSEGKTDDKDTEDCFGDEWTKTFNEKLVSLETWVKNVESDAFPKLKVLETKTEELSVGMQTALEGASLAESKCSALGAELVKVFRMLASSRKESPTKMMMGDGDDDPEQHHHQHRARCTRSHHSGVKSKTLSSHAACTYCKRAAMKGSNDLADSTKEHQDAGHSQSDSMENGLLEGQKTGYYYESSKIDNMSPCMEKSYKESGPHGKLHLEQHPLSLKQENQDLNHAKAYHGGEEFSLEKGSKRNGGLNEKLHRKGELMEKLEDYEALEHLLGQKNNSELKAFEGKLPITHEKLEDKRLDCAKKDTTHTGSGKNCQSTNIRLEAGKIQVNVSHRSAVLSGSRLTKRGDTISVRP